MAGPQQPSVGVGAVVIHAGRVLLIRRGKQPLQGRWVVPGGTLELGETLEDCVVREVREETGLTVRPRELATVFDRIERDAQGKLLYHFVIVDFLCDLVSGTLRAASDAEAAAFAAPDELPGFDLPAKALEVVQDGFRRSAAGAAAESHLRPDPEGA